MENAIASLSPVQLLITLAIQVWIIVAPILILRKLDYIASLLEPTEESDSPES